MRATARRGFAPRIILLLLLAAPDPAEGARPLLASLRALTPAAAFGGHPDRGSAPARDADPKLTNATRVNPVSPPLSF